MQGVSPTRPSILFSIPPVEVAQATLPSLSTATAPTVPILPLHDNTHTDTSTYLDSQLKDWLHTACIHMVLCVNGLCLQYSMWSFRPCLTFGTPQGWHQVPGSSSNAYGNIPWRGILRELQECPFLGQTYWRPLLLNTRDWSAKKERERVGKYTANKIHRN